MQQVVSQRTEMTTFRVCFRCSGGVNGAAVQRPASLMEPAGTPPTQSHIVRVVVNRDDRGYGMKVSGDKPVYVQSVKEGKQAGKKLKIVKSS